MNEHVCLSGDAAAPHRCSCGGSFDICYQHDTEGVPQSHDVVHSVGADVVACACGVTFHTERNVQEFRLPRDAVTLWNEHRAQAARIWAISSAPEDAVTEYRVMYWSEHHEGWFSHTGKSATTNPATAEAWLEQATHRGGRIGPVEAYVESRTVTPWTRDIPHA